MVDPQAHFALIRRLRGTDREIVGAYHSHPHSSATPSRSDISECWSPELVHVIVSLEGVEPEVRAWSIVGGTVGEIPIVQTESGARPGADRASGTTVSE